MASKQESSYDSIFNFIFGHQKRKPKKGRPPKPMDLPAVSGLAEGFVEVAVAPWLYPIEQMTYDIEYEADSLGKISVKPLGGMKVEAGVGSLSRVITNPRAFIDKSFQKYKEGKKWGRIGGGTRLMDAALLGLWGKKIGLSTMESVGVGGSIFGLDDIHGFQSPALGRTSGQVSSYKAAHSSTQNLIDHVEHNYNVSRADLEKIVEVSSNVGSKANDDKADRIDKMKEELKTKGLSESDADKVAQEFWGKTSDDGDHGVWWTSTGQKNMRKKSFDTMLKKLRVEESKALALGTSEGQKKAKALGRYRNWMTQYAGGGGAGGLFSFGRMVGGGIHLKNWAQEVSAKRFLPAIIMGDVGALETIMTFGGMSKSLGLNDANFKKGFNKNTLYGVEKGTLFKGTDTNRGKLTNFVYYYNPYNFAKGLVWDGRTWANFARMLDGRNARLSGVFQNIARFTPKQLLMKLKKHTFGKLWTKIKEQGFGRLKKIFAEMASKYLKKFAQDLIALPVKEIIKQILIKFVTQLLGNIALPGVGIFVGIALDIIINIAVWIGEKLLKPMLELLALIIMGGVALLLIAFVSDDGGMMYAQRYQNPPITAHFDPSGVDGGGPPQYGGEYSAVYSGTAQEIFEQVKAEMGAGLELHQVDCGGADCGGEPCSWICGTQGPNCDCPSGAWCYNGGNAGIFCRGDRLATASSEYLTGLFRHELAHSIQFRNYGTWPSWGTVERVNVTEWGAEHISGNGGSYCFYTSDGGYMSGVAITNELLSRGCSSSLLDQAARGDYNALIALESSCGLSPRTYITRRQIGGTCTK